MQVKTMLYSLFANGNTKNNIFIFYSKLTGEEIKQIYNFIRKYKNDVNFIKIEDEYFNDAPLYRNCSKEIYYRLLAMEKLPYNIKRILYLDIDIIINNDLNKFYEADFENKYFIVCEDSNHSRKNKELYRILNIPEEYKYFNSGVMLFNLELLRKDNQSEAINKFMSGEWKEKNKDFHDQNVLNALYYKDVKYEDNLIYNCFIKNIYGEERKKCLKDACIFHFAGIKPWNYKYPSKCYKIWWKYANKVGYRHKYYLFKIMHFVYMLRNRNNEYYKFLKEKESKQ